MTHKYVLYVYKIHNKHEITEYNGVQQHFLHTIIPALLSTLTHACWENELFCTQYNNAKYSL